MSSSSIKTPRSPKDFFDHLESRMQLPASLVSLRGASGADEPRTVKASDVESRFRNSLSWVVEGEGEVSSDAVKHQDDGADADLRDVWKKEIREISSTSTVLICLSEQALRAIIESDDCAALSPADVILADFSRGKQSQGIEFSDAVVGLCGIGYEVFDIVSLGRNAESGALERGSLAFVKADGPLWSVHRWK